ncbi:MAG: hypothetical protein ACP5OH_04010 [Nitrososphaerota archaeon]
MNRRLLPIDKLKMTFLPITCFTIVLFLVLICSSNQYAYSQSSQAIVPSPPQLESIKIDNLVPSQSVDLKKELSVTGESSDNATKDCSVSVIVNGIQPYQSAVATGPGGATDYSQWKFVLDEQYTQLNEGSNKITAKLLCETAPARWYSVVVYGVPSSNLSEAVSPEPTQQQSNISEAVSPEPTQQQSNISEAVSPEPTQQKLLVTISPLKNPLARGDRQNTTITVTDSSNRPIANAQIDGKLIYPGDDFEKEFKGITDLEGKFVYSWTVGKKGDVGPLDIEAEVSSQGYPSVAAHSSFEILESGESSNSEDPFQSQFQSP